MMSRICGDVSEEDDLFDLMKEETDDIVTKCRESADESNRREQEK